MRMCMYANATETRLGGDGSLARTDFFCIEQQVHTVRQTLWRTGQVFGTESWRTPTPCDGSCEVWVMRAHDMPQDVRTKCEQILAEDAVGEGDA